MKTTGLIGSRGIAQRIAKGRRIAGDRHRFRQAVAVKWRLASAGSGGVTLDTELGKTVPAVGLVGERRQNLQERGLSKVQTPWFAEPGPGDSANGGWAASELSGSGQDFLRSGLMSFLATGAECQAGVSFRTALPFLPTPDGRAGDALVKATCDFMSEFLPAAKQSELEDGGKLLVEVDDRLVILFRVGDDVFCIDDVCTHDGGTLSDGELNGFEIACPRHGARFDIRCGAAMCMPATQATVSHQTKVDGDTILVKIED